MESSSTPTSSSDSRAVSGIQATTSYGPRPYFESHVKTTSDWVATKLGLISPAYNGHGGAFGPNTHGIIGGVGYLSPTYTTLLPATSPTRRDSTLRVLHQHGAKGKDAAAVPSARKQGAGRLTQADIDKLEENRKQQEAIFAEWCKTKDQEVKKKKEREQRAKQQSMQRYFEREERVREEGADRFKEWSLRKGLQAEVVAVQRAFTMQAMRRAGNGNRVLTRAEREQLEAMEARFELRTHPNLLATRRGFDTTLPPVGNPPKLDDDTAGTASGAASQGGSPARRSMLPPLGEAGKEASGALPQRPVAQPPPPPQPAPAAAPVQLPPISSSSRPASSQNAAAPAPAAPAPAPTAPAPSPAPTGPPGPPIISAAPVPMATRPSGSGSSPPPPADLPNAAEPPAAQQPPAAPAVEAQSSFTFTPPQSSSGAPVKEPSGEQAEAAQAAPAPEPQQEDEAAVAPEYEDDTHEEAQEAPPEGGEEEQQGGGEEQGEVQVVEEQAEEEQAEEEHEEEAPAELDPEAEAAALAMLGDAEHDDDDLADIAGAFQG